MKHFYFYFRVQRQNLHKNWNILFLLVAKSEILYISVIAVIFPITDCGITQALSVDVTKPDDITKGTVTSLQ
jgi:hypothetical protein